MPAAPRPRVCVVVPHGTWLLEPLADALRDTGAASDIVAIWAGDPHSRPVLSELGIDWCQPDEPTGIGWNRLLAALPSAHYEWAVACAAVTEMLRTDPTPVVVLRAGSVGVLGALNVLVSDHPLTLIERVSDPAELGNDGLAPNEADLIRRGRFIESLACFGPGAGAALSWLGEQLTIHADVAVGAFLERCAARFGWASPPGGSVLVAGWMATLERPPAAVDIDNLDRQHPWCFRFEGGPARIRLSQHPAMAAAVADAVEQCQGMRTQLRLPGGSDVDPAIRSLVGEAIVLWRRGEGDLPPQPWSDKHSEFVAWLESPPPATVDIGRYWLALRETRPDLLSAFSHAHGRDGAAFRRWIEDSWRIENRPPLIRSTNATLEPIRSTTFDPHGLNVLGYLDYDQSQGHIARQIVAALQQATCPVRQLNHHRSLGAPRASRVTDPRQAIYKTNVVVVNADQFEFVVADHAKGLLADRHTIGYWFWELEHVLPRMIAATGFVDEIWAGSQFITDAFAAVTSTPVRRVSLPIEEPQPSLLGRADFNLPEDRFVFLCTFDQYSVPERKNPFSVIRAFRQAFADGQGPILWIKTLNGDRAWRQHERLLLAAAGRSDIIVWDKHLSRSDQMAVLNTADCLVSLHRSEGLGLHCGEAMWLAKPVIATRYSGNLDFMTDDNSALIDFTMIPVSHGDGIYPPAASWADPSIDHAAEWMRRLAQDAGLARRLGLAGQATIRAQPSLAEAGRMMATLAGVHGTWTD